MNFDQRVPKSLRKVQEWFGGVIGQPIDYHSQICPIAPSGRAIIEEAPLFISPSPTLEPADRIQIYNQQYWWRFFTILHDAFPVLVRLFGYKEFNFKIAVPYLVKYPSNHWALAYLGNRLPIWVEEDYHAADRQLVLDAADMDWAYTVSFLSSHLPSIRDGQSPDLMTQKLYLQPHLHLLTFGYHLFQFRQEFLKQEPEYWFENNFPHLDNSKVFSFVLYRNFRDNGVVYEEISHEEYQLLSRFREGSSIEAAIDWLDACGGSVYEKATANLHVWLQKWVINQWFAIEKKPADNVC